MPEPKRTYNSTSGGGLAMRLQKTGAPKPGEEKCPTPPAKENETAGQAGLINRLIDRIKTV